MDPLGTATNLDPKAFAGPIAVTFAYFALYYGFMNHILVVKLRLRKSYAKRGETFDRYFSQDRAMLAADRTQLNMLEHMPVFLVLFWLHAFLVSSSEATYLGVIYTASRAFYPVMLKGRMGNQIPMRILYVTVTNYIILLIMAVRIGQVAFS